MAKTYLATRSDISDMATNTNLSAHKNDKNNPHGVTATQIGAEVTSNRTDDIAGNSTSSTKYPSAKGVADYVEGNYLPLTGGTITGPMLRFGNGYGVVWGQGLSTGNGAYVNFGVYDAISHDDSNKRSLYVYNKFAKEKNDEAVIFEDVDDGSKRNYKLLGEHNFHIDATENKASNDMNLFMRQGVHFKWYRTGPNTLNTPAKAGLTGNYNYAIIMSYGISQAEGKQVAFYSGMNKVYVRSMLSNVISDWQELGGGGMRVPIAYGHGQVDSNSATLTITGKGTIWLTKMYSTGTTTLIIDGVTLTNSEIQILNSSSSYAESIPFDFEKSVSYKITSSGNIGYTTTYYSYQLYK